MSVPILTSSFILTHHYYENEDCYNSFSTSSFRKKRKISDGEVKRFMQKENLKKFLYPFCLLNLPTLTMNDARKILMKDN